MLFSTSGLPLIGPEMAVTEHGSGSKRNHESGDKVFDLEEIMEDVVLAEDVLVDPVEAAGDEDPFRAVDSMELNRGRIAIDVAF
jgi:hypothetical protein